MVDPKPPTLEIIRKRADFVLITEKHYRKVTPAFVLQIHKRPENEGNLAIRVGFTATKKMGGAVFRNRAKRRLRELARLHLLAFAKPGHDYVFIAREGIFSRPFHSMIEDLKACLEKS